MKKIFLVLLICLLTIPLYAELTKKVVIDKIEVLEDGQIQIREDTRVYDNDGTMIGHSYKRHCLDVADDLNKEDARVIAVANTVWTKEVKDARIAEKDKIINATKIDK